MAYIDSLYDNYFLEYASYYIKDRAIPHIDDGLKPVQRRILYALQQIDDGKFHKVANVVGQTMQYHPHGDQSIYGALVVLANKDLFIEKQGNFGNIHTGDDAAAARYIECRLTPLAKETLFNKSLTSIRFLLRQSQSRSLWFSPPSSRCSSLKGPRASPSAWLPRYCRTISLNC